MFKDKSMAGVGAAGTILSMFLRAIGIDVDEGVVTEFVVNAIATVSFILWLYGQFRREDLIWGFWRKQHKA